MIQIDEYILDVLMRDLTGHDRSVSSYLVYLHLWHLCGGDTSVAVKTSHQQMAGAVGISKSAVQNGIRNLLRRKLVKAKKITVTSIPEYRLMTPWRRANAGN